MYVRNSDSALTNWLNLLYVSLKGAIDDSRSSILPSALSTCPCHSDHFRRAIFSRMSSPNAASHCTNPLLYCSNTVSFIVR
jgi:hypothetical protein